MGWNEFEQYEKLVSFTYSFGKILTETSNISRKVCISPLPLFKMIVVIVFVWAGDFQLSLRLLHSILFHSCFIIVSQDIMALIHIVHYYHRVTYIPFSNIFAGYICWVFEGACADLAILAYSTHRGNRFGHFIIQFTSYMAFCVAERD